MFRLLSTVLVPLMCAACTGFHSSVPAPEHSREQLLDTSGLQTVSMEEIARVDILELDEDIRAYLARHVPDDMPGHHKARAVLEVIVGRGPIDLQYDNLKTYTAVEAWHSGEGNCMSFTNLYIAMAREVGLKARYQLVQVPPNWAASGGLFINNLHINALVDYPLGDDQVVDFDLENFNEDLPRRRISDRAATARYHSNMGVHWMLQENPERAFAHLVQSIRIEPDNPALWTNLGALYLKSENIPYATAAFLVALELDRSDLVAISNLARIYRKGGDTERAQLFADRVEYFRAGNPYYLYHLAGEHYEAGRYPAAIAELRRAIAIQPEHRFYRLLGLAELQEGHRELAEESFEMARQHASNAAERNLYSRKLSILRGDTPQ